MLDKLHVEHDHIRKTLNLLEMQFLDLCRDKHPDLSMMRSIIVYIQEYPEQTHHPIEDMMYSIILEREKKVELLQNLITDHTELEAITRKLRESLELFIQKAFSKEELKKQLSRFLIRQHQHLYIEEIEIYPLARQLLTEIDWEKIQTIVPYRDDPIFGERTQTDYEILYREIEGSTK